MKIVLKNLLTAGFLTSTLFTTAYAASDTSVLSASDAVVVVIDGTKLTRGEVEQKHTANLFQARNTYYQAERKIVDEYVDQYLLERQARKENITVDELLKRHITDVIAPDPSDEAMHVYYEGLDTSEPFDTAKTKIREFLRQKRMLKAKADFMQQLKKDAKIEVTLAAPRAEASLKGVPVRGAKNAKVTLIEFADFECPYCQQFEPKLAKLQEEFQGQLAFAYKDLPLPMHSHAQKAAEAAHCAMEQGKFWEYHDLVFSNRKLEVSQLKESARTLKLDGDAFDKCLDSGATAAAVKANLDEATALALPGTPGFFLNGRFIEGSVSYDALRSAVLEELARTAKPVETATR